MTQRNVPAVIFWMVGALLSFSASAVAVRALSRSFSVFEMLALRNAAGVGILLVAAALNPALQSGLQPRRMRLNGLRNGVHFAATAAWAFGLTLLPLATVFALEFTTPAWVGILAALVLRERLTGPRLGSIALGFLGVLLIVRPGSESLQPAAFIVLGAAAGFAVTTIVTKVLTRTESTFSILFWMNAMQLPLNLAGASPAFWLKLELSQILPLLGICLGGLLSHLCLTNAYRHGDAVMVVPLDFLRLPLIALIGWRLYGEPLDPYVFLGGALMVAGILWSLARESGRTWGRSAR